MTATSTGVVPLYRVESFRQSRKSMRRWARDNGQMIVAGIIAVILLLLSFLLGMILWFEGSRTSEEPFEVDGNDDLLSRGYEGVGSEEDPVVIENMEITASSDNGIVIKNTSLHLIIRNIEVKNGFEPCWYYFDGVCLDNVTNCSIISCKFSSDYHAITMEHCREVTISSVTAEDCGIRVFACEGISMADSQIVDLTIDSSAEIALHDNDFSGGIILYGDSPVHFDSHEIPDTNLVNSRPILYYAGANGLVLEGVDGGQVIVANCTDLEMSGLAFEGSVAAIQLAFVDRAEVSESTFSGCTEGVRLTLASNISIHDCAFESCEYGSIIAEESGNIQILSNTVYKGTPGIRIAYSRGVDVVANRFSSCTGDSLQVYESSSITVSGNTYVQFEAEVGSPFCHVYFSNVRDSVIEDNALDNEGQTTGNYYAVFLFYCQRILVEGNSISDHCGGSPSVGISLGESTDVTLMDNVIEGFDVDVSPGMGY